MGKFTLYKYRAINDWSIRTLRTGQMWFSSPAKLNDTFEFSLPVFVQLEPREMIELFEKRFKIEYASPKLLGAMMKHGGSTSFPATEEFFQDFLRSTTPENRVLFAITQIHFLRNQGLTTEDIIARLALARSELRQHLENDLREAYSNNQRVNHQCGVLSLSGVNNDPLMWAHYADSCRGMCIGLEFDSDALIRSDFIPLWVEYSEELPKADASRFFSRDKYDVMEMLKIFCATKHVAWKHEAEFRLVSKAGDVALDVPGRIVEVILGEKATDADARLVLTAVEQRSGTRILKMMREPGTWKYRAYGSTI